MFKAQGRCVQLSEAQRTAVWRRWKAGESLHRIGRAFDRPHTSIHCLLAHHGGIVPASRRRSVVSLTLGEREDISRGLACGSSIRDIAKGLERAASTVSREANEANHPAWNSALRPKRCLLSIQVKLRKVVASKLILDWSPEQISGWLKIRYRADESMHVSHETIYRSLFIQARGVLKKELIGHLRSKRRIRRSQHARIFNDSRGQIAETVSIRERPAEIEDRAVPGHWEGDLIAGSKNSHIATLVERHSRFTALVRVRSKDTAAVVAALSRQIRRLPTSLRRSLTWDRGLEMAQHQSFTIATNVKVYFCDPHSPWQRGTNENTNRLLRQYLPKRTDLKSALLSNPNTQFFNWTLADFPYPQYPNGVPRANVLAAFKTLADAAPSTEGLSFTELGSDKFSAHRKFAKSEWTMDSDRSSHQQRNSCQGATEVLCTTSSSLATP
jgi:IS30 family transposase